MVKKQKIVIPIKCNTYNSGLTVIRNSGCWVEVNENHRKNGKDKRHRKSQKTLMKQNNDS